MPVKDIFAMKTSNLAKIKYCYFWQFEQHTVPFLKDVLKSNVQKKQHSFPICINELARMSL